MVTQTEANMAGQELTTQRATEVGAPDAAALISVIERAATNPDVDIDKMERLMQMHERIMGRQAEQAFNEALVEAQSETGRIATDAENPQTRSRYASYAALDKVLRPIYTSHGFSISFDTGDTDSADMVRVVAYVSHKAGHTRTYKALLPADGKGAKGGDVMTKTHATGSAMSYGMRYLLKMIFNVAVGEADDDGNAAAKPVQTITEEQVADLAALIEEVGADKPKFLQWLQVDALENLPAKHYKQAVAALEKKRK